MRALVLVALLATPALAGSQSLLNDSPLPYFQGGQAVLRLNVLPSRPFTGLEITIYADHALRSGDPVDARLSAIATSADGADQVASSDSCPGLRASMQAFRLIPPIETIPRGLRPRASILLPIEPTKKDGASYRITMDIATPNGSGSLVTIDDYSGDYAVWGDRLIRDLSSCWTPKP